MPFFPPFKSIAAMHGLTSFLHTIASAMRYAHRSVVHTLDTLLFKHSTNGSILPAHC
ncbi:MAG: hypothetical protein BSOLF_2110 [Candidatus Carbobacillus altaicus]|uniref:Uncharacterized protein n=1 Tax=Candidatus Carbonibacillus altaicus TaxID=2163959 RepID=A0A2R6XYG8_9BACL|nr:MAG: hypothetical protein BSOLF_2110 [Candidatus Carbobacillus altaicus]